MFNFNKPKKDRADLMSSGEAFSEINSEVVPTFKGVLSETPLHVPVNCSLRYLRLSLQIEEVFHLDAVEVFDTQGQNVALHKNVFVSSRFEDKYDGAGVVRGNKNGGAGFHTSREQSPWLIIDLQEMTDVESIKVFNRDDRFYTRSLSLLIEHSSDLVSWNILYDNWAELKELEQLAEAPYDKALIAALKLDSDYCSRYLHRVQNEVSQEAAEKFQAHVNKILAPLELALGPHGLTRTFELRTEKEKDHILNNLNKLLAWLNDEFGVAAFISSGTLLGVVRDGKFISHDDDIDICYISNETTEVAIKNERERLVTFLSNKGCKLTKSELAHYWCVTPSGHNIDIFTGFIEDGFCSMNPISRKELSADKVLPVQTVDHQGHEIYLPADPESVLTVNYGPNWKTPDPLWTFDWQGAKKDFSFLYFQ